MHDPDKKVVNPEKKLEGRQGFYDIIMVCRPHNMANFAHIAREAVSCRGFREWILRLPAPRYAYRWGGLSRLPGFVLTPYSRSDAETVTMLAAWPR